MSDQRTGTIAAFEGLRAVAALMVFAVHWVAFLHGLGWHTSSSLAYLAATGYLGVEIFFVLSGYLIWSSALGQRSSTGSFLVRRMVRIFPVYWLLLALYILALAVGPRLAKATLVESWSTIIANVLLLPGVYDFPGIVTVAWSLSYEIHFYVMVACFLAIGLFRRSVRFRLVTVTVIAITLLVLAYPYARLGAFVLFVPGILAAEAVRLNWRMPSWWGNRLALGVPLLGIGIRGLIATADITRLIAAWLPILSLLLVGFPMALLVVHLRCRLNEKAGWLSSEPLRTFGEASYSFYLIHGPALHLVALALGLSAMTATHPIASAALGSLAGIMLATALARASFLFVEQPTMRWTSRLLRQGERTQLLTSRKSAHSTSEST